MTSSLCFCNPSVELDMFYKICKFENHIRKNDVIMMSLPKTMEKFGPPRNQTNYTSFERY